MWTWTSKKEKRKKNEWKEGRKAFDSLIETLKSTFSKLVKNITFLNTNDEIKSQDKQIATKTNR